MRELYLAAAFFLSAIALPVALNAPTSFAGQAARLRPTEVLKLHLGPGRPPQGIWQFGNGQYLVTQDIDGRDRKAWVRFNLIGKDGEVLKKWEINYGTHGQSLFLRRSPDGFTVFTESRDRNGITLFHLSEDRTDLSYVRTVVPVDSNGQTIEFEAFGVDDRRDAVAVLFGGRKKTVQSYRLTDFEAGILTPLGEPTVIRARKGRKLGSLQGIGTNRGIIYVLTGDAELKSRKYIVRVGPDGGVEPMQMAPDRDKAMFSYEPEGLYVQRGKVLFTMYDHFWTRVYEIDVE